MNGLKPNRWAICFTLATASLSQAAAFTVSNQSSCQAIPGAAWSAASVCSLGSNFTLSAGDSLTIAAPAALAVPPGVVLANNGGLLHVQAGAKLLMSGGAIQHFAGTIDNDGVWELRGATSAVTAFAGSVIDNGNLLQVVEGRVDNHGTLNQNTFNSFLGIENAGTLRNFGKLVNVAGADVYNKGRVENSGSIANNGIFENHCGVFVNTGTYTGSAVVSPNCWIGGPAGKWNSAANWSSGAVPSSSAYVVIASGAATIDFSMSWMGTLLLEGGQLVVAPNASFLNFAFVSLAPGAPGSSTLRNQGVFTNRGTLENSNRFVNDGTFTNFATVRAAAGAAATFVNSATWTNQGSITSQGIENAAGGVMANLATMQLTAGESFNAGRFTNSNPATLTLDNKLRNRAGASLVNQGKVFVTHRLPTPAGIDNEAGATVTNQTGAMLSITAAAAYVNNAGAMRNDGSVANGGIFNNTGVVCGSGTISGNPVAGNAPSPVCLAVANAGADQAVSEGTLVTLDGTASSTPNGSALNYFWAQAAGPAVMLNTTNPARPTFVAPYVAGPTVLSFRLVVHDGLAASLADFVDVVVASTNSAPVADAGVDRTAKAGSVVTLDGSKSFDPDGNVIASYEWLQVAGPFVALMPSANVANPSFTASAAGGATVVFKLRVSDGKEASVLSAGTDSSQADTVAVTTVENSRPVAAAGSDRMAAENSLVLLDGGASHDSDAGDVLSYAWRQVAGPSVVLSNPASAATSFTAPSVTVGAQVTLTFELVVRDNDAVNPLYSAPALVNIGVYNLNDPPRCDLAAASESSLWPPDSKMSTVSITGVLDDGASGMPMVVRITGVRQDEPVNGLERGDVGPDAVIVAGGSSHDTVQLRRERSGKGNGRVYTIMFTADDGLARCSGAVKVEVVHSRNGQAAVDDGAVYDSTGN